MKFYYVLLSLLCIQSCLCMNQNTQDIVSSLSSNSTENKLNKLDPITYTRIKIVSLEQQKDNVVRVLGYIQAKMPNQLLSEAQLRLYEQSQFAEKIEQEKNKLKELEEQKISPSKVQEISEKRIRKTKSNSSSTNYSDDYSGCDSDSFSSEEEAKKMPSKPNNKRIKVQQNTKKKTKKSQNKTRNLKANVYLELIQILRLHDPQGSGSTRNKVREDVVHKYLTEQGTHLLHNPSENKYDQRKPIYLKGKILLVGLPNKRTYQFNIDNWCHTIIHEPFSTNQEVDPCLLK
jgi:hypothetical protein